jgi:hypothetical protein
VTTTHPHAPPDVCPDLDALAELVDGVVAPLRRARIEAHLVTCEACRTTVALTRRALPATATDPVARTVASPSGGRRAGWIPFAAAAAALVAVGLAVARRADEPTTLDGAFAALRVSDATRFADASPLSAVELADRGATLLRGGIEWMTPVGTTTEARPTFEWAEVSGADGYRVSIVDADGNRLLTTTTRTPKLDGSALPEALVAGRDYVWKVTALDAPTPTDGATALHVATSAERAAVRGLVDGVRATVPAPLVDLVTAQVLLRRGHAAEALLYARRHAQRAPRDSMGRDTLALALRRLAPSASAR